jgi:hypothetical protein
MFADGLSRESDMPSHEWPILRKTRSRTTSSEIHLINDLGSQVDRRGASR